LSLTLVSSPKTATGRPGKKDATEVSNSQTIPLILLVATFHRHQTIQLILLYLWRHSTTAKPYHLYYLWRHSTTAKPYTLYYCAAKAYFYCPTMN
jgi:hypothetical protein